ncbi:hypothetical protein HAT86_15265 [Roseovarius gahaiensis]|uniref:Uncharacterized protein n=1 Tax=Roseovarius gahaiensis TaxID=2716691 RepID=A0A967BD34_9RHOB|nr:hypothetical protein [Roseovarius gahaiensis]NHQ75810.1 hypothetical protein [Roseovarius gahaiensis]
MKHTYDMKIQKIIRLFNERVAGTKQSVAHSYIACLERVAPDQIQDSHDACFVIPCF